MKLSRKQYLIVCAVFLVMMSGVVLGCIRASQEDILNLRARAGLNAAVYSEDLEKDLQQGIDITESVEDLLIDTDGNIQNFEDVAEHRMEDYIESIQLAPGGVVTDIYPLEGNEAGMIDLMNDPARGPVVQYGKKHDAVTMQGPFDLKQGGQGLAIRNPVFLKDNAGYPEFWGFAIVIIRVPDIYEKTLNALESFGYDYSLYTTVSALSGDSEMVASSFEDGRALNDAESFQFTAGECTWTLNVVPKSGWISHQLFGVALSGATITALVTILTYMLLGLQEQQKQLRRIAVTDDLTGLLSRRGFMERLYKCADMNSEVPMTAVFIDLDDFKQINDLHGHLIGDEFLKSLAGNLKKSFPEDSIIGRTGGDEFCVIILGRTAEECGDIIRRTVETDLSFRLESKEYSYTISAGYADYPLQASDCQHLLTLADQALYVSKLTGKRRSVHYDPSMSNIKHTQLGFSVKSIAAGIPGAFLIYSAYGDEQILFANDDLIEMTGCTDLDDFLEHTKYSFKNFVHPDDIDRVERSIWAQINSRREKAGTKNFDDYAEGRIRTKNGSGKHVHGVGRLIHTENYGDVFFVFIREKDSFKDLAW